MVSQKSTLSASNIKYLLAMRELNMEPRGVRSTDLARSIGVTKPSVYTMAKSLCSLGLVEKDRYGAIRAQRIAIRFTQDGEDVAKRYERYYNTLCSCLCTVFPKEADIRSAACAMLAEMPENNIEEMCDTISERAKKL